MRRRRGFKARDGWTRLSAPGRKCGAHWRHEETGWELRHCGHPTANWPYYLVEPRSRLMVVTHNGLGFKTLAVAMDAVASILAGHSTATTEGCERRLMRVVEVSADRGGRA